ncbi:probable potassium transporter 17 [Selaginella moellendorffii]|uniref:probable potassium transporter 17 n=1 Tax=Selaginella moellendorffii TaxID=88036 RepID=UPI000D1C8664|nr:probable potassium transporter 17 [Selaginella moellendorffii]|eukprot:XP_024535498.1 probable potassium transporter 17 [Selaginella moellendorffii]
MEGNAHPCQSSPDRDQGARAAARAVDFEECVQVLDDPGQPSPPPLPLRLSSKADIRRSLSRTSRSFSSRINSFYKDQEVRRVILSSVRRFLAWFLLFLAQIFGCRETLWLAYQTLGVVYGDLGTSPLYVYPTAQIDSRNEREYLGVLSVIFWTLTLIGVVKYVLIVLHANDHGEGGTFALYSLLCRHANVGRHAGKHYGRLESDTEFSYFGDAERVRVHTRAKMFLEKSEIAQKILLVCVTFGTCMVIGDGVLTPAISVHAAVVIAISCVIISALFLLQSIGTHRVSCIFSPIMATWFASTTVIGIYNIMNYYPTVLKALSPHYAIRFFVRNKRHGWEMLNSIVLCITGSLFAYIAFIAVVYPSLIITYAGETAFLIKHPEHRIDAFFKSVPSPVFWPVFVVATLAAIVASQALITATFSVLKQSVSFGCFPRIKLVHTSASQEGQIYSPEVNYLLLGLCLAVVIGFQDSDGIGNAYGNKAFNSPRSSNMFSSQELP